MIDDKALELGRMLGQSDEYRVLLRATDRMKEDVELQKGLAAVEQLAQQLERTAQAGQEPGKEQIEQYDRALQAVQASPVYQQVVAAQANFEKFLAKVNARIYEGLKKGAASPIITLS